MVPVPPQYQVNVGANRSRAIVDWDFELTTVHFKRLSTAGCHLLDPESVDFPPMEAYFQKYNEDIVLTKRSTRTMDLENVLKKKKPEEVKQLMDTLLQEVGTLNPAHTQCVSYTFTFEQCHHFCLHHWLLYAFGSARESGGIRQTGEGRYARSFCEAMETVQHLHAAYYKGAARIYVRMHRVG